MKSLRITLLLCLTFTTCFAQISIEKLNLSTGPYSAGFQHYKTYDSTRTYSRIMDWDQQTQFRPIEISLWYPAEAPSGRQEQMTVLDYMEVYKQEMEWEHLPNTQVLSWFFNGNIPKDLVHLAEITKAFPSGQIAQGNFPVLIYAPGMEGTSIENFALFEFLASHGYIILACPSRGADNRYFTREKLKNIETQAQDIAFLIKECQKIKQADKNQIATIDHSFGGLSAILAQMKNTKIKAVLSLDGSTKYQYEALPSSVFFNLDRMTVPFIHFAQKNIPDSVLEADNLEAALNTNFTFYDQLKWSEAYQLKSHDLTHSYFTTLGLLFQERDPRQDRADQDLLLAHRLMANYCLHFLNIYLKDDQESRKWLMENREGFDFKMKNALQKPASFNDFNKVAKAAEYQNLAAIYKDLKGRHPKLELPQYQLNNLGLQMVFNPETSLAGISMFNLALELYPKSANLFDSLAEAYLHLGNTEKAIQNFQRSLALNPENLNAVERLKELKID